MPDRDFLRDAGARTAGWFDASGQLCQIEHLKDKVNNSMAVAA